jgi:outer membrane protein
MRAVFFAAVAAFFLAAVPAAAQARIAIVDLQRALNEVEEGASAKSALKKEFDDKQKQLDTRQGELKQMKDELDAQSTMMTPEKKAEKVAELQRKLMEVQQIYMNLQQDLSKREQEATAKIFEKMAIILRQVGEEDGFDAIVERTAVPYFKPSLDVTNELIRRYNAAYGKKSGSKK